MIPDHGYWEATECTESLGFICQIPIPQSNCLQSELDKRFADQGMNFIYFEIFHRFWLFFCEML